MIAEKFGYPVLLKAAAGGGGKGMRLVREARELASSLETVAAQRLVRLICPQCKEELAATEVGL